MFHGSHLYNLDDRGRVKMAPEFASALGASFTVTRGRSQCLWVWPDATWRAWMARLEPDLLADEGQLTLLRFFIGSAQTVSLDAQGRLMIPLVLRQFADLKREAILVGTGERVEIWSRARWDAFEAGVTDAQIEAHTKQLAAR